MIDISTLQDFRNQVLTGHFNFNEMALRIFHYQAKFVPVYAEWCRLRNVQPESVSSIAEIPCLPISLFKEHKVMVAGLEAQIVFESSGTTGQVPSKHYVDNILFYQDLAVSIFERQFGSLKGKVILALLPHYLERGNSSLVAMVQHFMNVADSSLSGFYLHDYEQLFQALHLAKKENKEVILFGVTYALLHAAELANQSGQLLGSNVVVIETGGMKGRGKELIRTEVHELLRKQWGASTILSEYGMTELLSQGYTTGKEIFQPGFTMKVLRRLADDPTQVSNEAGKGVLNIIDLGNVHSCSFLATDDQGTLYEDGSFTVEGRLDASELRGCNLLYFN